MFQRLTAADLARHRAVGSNPEYVEFLTGLTPGEGGRINAADAGVGRQTVKNRLNSAAAATGVKIKFVRSSADTVVFEVVGAAEAPKRRRKAAAG
jgi:hypothetical protein